MAKDVNSPTVCILLPATINTGGIVFLQRSDPVIRENDYINAIRKWLQETNYTIVFCENSNSDLRNIEEASKGYKHREIEFLQFDGNSFPRELGKGYGMLLTIRYALQNSSLIKNADYIVAVTGRYFIKNIKKIITPLSKEKNIYIMVDLEKNLTWADARIYAFKPSFVLDYLSPLQDLINDTKGFYLEHALARATLQTISDGHRWMPLPFKPFIVGYSGTSNTPYNASRLRWLAGEIIHRVKNYLIERY
jgi:hypothetical protein